MIPKRYKPAPLDLSAVELSSKMEELVDKLAENTHNTWARERISQGWTYGLNEDGEKLRSPHLVQYAFVDEAIKIANRNTVRTSPFGSQGSSFFTLAMNFPGL